MNWWTPAGVTLLANTVLAQTPMQHAMPDSVPDTGVTWTVGGQAIALVTHASPAHAGRSLTEGYLTQPMVMGSLSGLGASLSLQGMLDLEGITLERGELDAGIWGEGYVDRRHPHTYLHELVATASGAAGHARFSFAVGKGFVPFGTDDPMVRPFEKYPVNHHIAQIVERVLATAAIRTGPLLVEAARFNGDEPTSPSDFPNRDRLWDSWAARATLLPTSALELQGSIARVKSPELAAGGGLDQRKANLSLRYETRPAAPMSMPMAEHTAMNKERSAGDEWHRYALLEWGRSSDYDRGARAFSFNTGLAEAELSGTVWSFAARAERTERPEEDRLPNPFRTQRPETDFSINGRTRWDVASLRVSAIAARSGQGAITPFIELARQHATAIALPAVFDPHAFYGDDTMWSLSAGITLSGGVLHRRTGSYGAAMREGSAMAGTISMSAVSEGTSAGGSAP